MNYRIELDPSDEKPENVDQTENPRRLRRPKVKLEEDLGVAKWNQTAGHEQHEAPTHAEGVLMQVNLAPAAIASLVDHFRDHLNCVVNRKGGEVVAVFGKTTNPAEVQTTLERLRQTGEIVSFDNIQAA